MKRLLWLPVLAVAASLASACAVTHATHTNEPLYFAMELKQHGQTVAAPKLVGFEGHKITAERAFSEGVSPYRLQLKPDQADIGYSILLDVELPSGRSVGQFGLLHGEERKIAIDAETELTLRMMRVDSDEFRALMAVEKNRVIRM